MIREFCCMAMAAGLCCSADSSLCSSSSFCRVIPCGGLREGHPLRWVCGKGSEALPSMVATKDLRPVIVWLVQSARPPPSGGSNPTSCRVIITSAVQDTMMSCSMGDRLPGPRDIPRAATSLYVCRRQVWGRCEGCVSPGGGGGVLANSMQNQLGEEQSLRAGCAGKTLLCVAC